MDPISIAAIVAMIAGAAVQYQAQTEAQDRQQAQIQQSLAAQEELQKRAESKAMQTAEKFAPQDRLAEQAAIAEQISSELIAPVSESQAIRAEQQTTQGNVSGDYTAAKATSDANVLKNADALARLLGKTTSANRLRMNEGIRLMDTGMAIDQLNNFSKGQQAADSIAIQQAGLVNPGQVFAGQLLGAAGSAGLMYGGAAAASPAAKTGATTTGLTSSSTVGLKPATDSSIVGLKMPTDSNAVGNFWGLKG